MSMNKRCPDCPKKTAAFIEARAARCRPCSNRIRKQKTAQKLYSKKHYKKVVKKESLIKALGRGDILPAETESFYDHYKEPLQAVEGGYGYYGTLGTNEAKTHVQCHICGLFYRSLNGHIRMTHHMPVPEYKQEYGLSVTTALIGEGVREKLINSHAEKIKRGELPTWLVQYNQDVQSGKKKHYGGKRTWSKEVQNKLGLCPDQVLEKITGLAKILGRTPSHDEFSAHYHFRFHSSIVYHFGSWNNAVEKAGMVPVGEARKNLTNKQMLIKYLKDFYAEHQRVPMNSDFKRGVTVSRYHYFKEFGTLNGARTEAGLPAIIPMPFGKHIELTPEQYFEYKAAREGIKLQETK